MVLGQQRAPFPIPEPHRGVGRIDDVGEQDRAEPALGTLLGTKLVDERVDLGEHGVGIAGPDQVIGARQLDEPRPRDRLGELAPLSHGDHEIPGAVQDERRDMDRRKHRLPVDLEAEAHQRPSAPRTERRARQPQESTAGRLVADEARRPEREAHSLRAPFGFDPVQCDLLGVREAGEQPGVGLELAERAEQDQAERSLRERRGEQPRHRTAPERAEQDGALGPSGVHHRPEVLHPVLHRRQRLGRHRVGQSGAGLVEQDQPRPLRQAVEEPREGWDVPREIEVRPRAGRQNQIEGALPDDLVRDVQVPRLRVSRPRIHAPQSRLRARAGTRGTRPAILGRRIEAVPAEGRTHSRTPWFARPEPFPTPTSEVPR